jgi:hypothetical protein
MPKLDRLGWADGLAFTCHGARIGVRVSEPAVLDQLPARLPPGWRRASSPVVKRLYSLVVGGQLPNSRVRRFHLLYAGSGRLARSLELTDVLGALEAHLDAVVPGTAPRRLFVRAGAVGWGGRAVVVLGLPSAGTSTLVAALVRAGAAYYSDRFAVFDGSGHVFPYAAPLSLGSDNGDPPSELSADALGGERGRAALPLGLVVMTEYSGGARWRPRVLSPGQAVLALMRHTVVARVRPGFALRTLERAVGTAAALEGRRGEAAQAATSLLRYLKRHSGTHLGWPALGGTRCRRDAGGREPCYPARDKSS